jgi:hypothetical protein
MQENKAVPPASGQSGEVPDQNPSRTERRIEIEGISGAPISTYESRSWKNDVFQKHGDSRAAERQERRQLEHEIRREIAGSHLRLGQIADELARPVDNINGNLGVLPDAAARKAVIERLASAILADRFDALGGVILPESYEPRTSKTGAHMREVWARFHRGGWGNAAADHDDWLRFHVEPAYITREAVARFVRDNANPWPKSLGAEPVTAEASPGPVAAPVIPTPPEDAPEQLPEGTPGESQTESGPLLRADLDNAYKLRISDLGRDPTSDEDEKWRKKIGIKRSRMRELRAAHRSDEAKRGGHPKGQRTS